MRAALIRIGIVGATALVLVVASAFAPIALRGIGMFDVDQVEVVGIHHMSAAAAVSAAGIVRGSNMFADPEPWIEALRAHALVADARIERRLPGTLVLRITETVPVAFARTPELRAIGANGRILPTNLRTAELDLPVLTVRTRVTGQGRAIDDATLGIVRFLATVSDSEPGLIGWISEAGMQGATIRLVLRTPTSTEVLVPADAEPARLRELHVTLGELATPSTTGVEDGRSLRAVDADLSRVKRIDARFLDQITVTMHRGKS